MTRNTNTGGLELLDVARNQITGAFFLGNVGLNWQFAGVAPVRAADESDLVLRNVNTGAFEVYDIVYMDSRSFRDLQVQTRGEFGGLGIEVTMEDGVIKVVAPIDETPAAKAGITANDIITHLDDEPVQGLTLNQAVEKMRVYLGLAYFSRARVL